MSQLYLPEREKTALKALDVRSLDEAVQEAIRSRNTSAMYAFELTSCGTYVAERLRRFEREIAAYANAKAATKQAETQARARHSGSELVHALQAMLRRVAEEEKETELFRIDDIIRSPRHLASRLEVPVGYHWRLNTDDAWTYSSITFFHNVDMSPDYTMLLSKRRLSPVKQEEARQEVLLEHWNHLVRLALHAVRDYLKSHRDASAIPPSFQARTESYSRWLNNFSCDFWRAQS